MEELIAQLKGLIYDQKHFTARGLTKLREMTKVDRHVLAGVIGLILVILLLYGEQSKYVANTLLVAVPLALFVVFPNECPDNDRMAVYIGSYALLTLLDPGLEKDWDSYYLFKVLILALLFPETAHEKTKKSRPNNQRAKKSRTVSFMSGPVNLTTSNDVITAKLLDDRITQIAEVTIPVYVDLTESENLDSLSYESMSETIDLTPSNDVITTNILDDGTKSTKLPDPRDLIINPDDQLTVNSPFMDNYSITLTNNSKRPIAVQLKSTCHDRVRIDPSTVVLKPRATLDFIVKIKPEINFDAIDVSHDRLAFDYVFCPSDAEKFDHKFFQSDAVRRRQNLPIQYNI